MNSTMKNLFRVGIVCDLDADRQCVRVNFDDLGTVSPWMQIAAFGASGDDYYWMPEIEEQVVCFFMPTGNAEGYVLYSVRGTANKPKAGNANKRYIRFADGGCFEYDKSTHTLTIDADNIVINGNISLTGGMNVTKDVVASGISLKGHIHGGVMSGGGNTGGPQ